MSALLTSSGAAKYLNINRHRIRGYVLSGQLAATALPDSKRMYFTKEDLDAFVQRMKVTRKEYWTEEAGPELALTGKTDSGQDNAKKAQKSQGQRSTTGKSFKYEVGWQEGVKR